MQQSANWRHGALLLTCSTLPVLGAVPHGLVSPDIQREIGGTPSVGCWRRLKRPSGGLANDGKDQTDFDEQASEKTPRLVRNQEIQHDKFAQCPF